MKPKVWTEVPLHPDALARLQAVAHVIEDGESENLPGAEVAIIGRSVVDDAFLEHAGPELKMVVRHGVGYNAVDVPAASARGVLAAYTPEGPTECTAEHAVGLMFAVAKCIAKADRYLHEGRAYSRADLRGTELFGQTLGVVGYGRIGRRVTEMCALGIRMNVLVYDPFLNHVPALPDGVSIVQSLDELLAQADFVTLHTPLMPETHHLIGEAELLKMKPTAILINASRGPVVDEAALIRVLRTGHLFGAGLDVFEIEPPEPDNPLLHMENVVVTPHSAANTTQGSYRMSSSVVDQTLQVLGGEQPTFLIDPAAWPGRVQAVQVEAQ
jgi:D-3-phosphoglycerate dehydrogenase / 2-oxoglutarate reductase